MENYFKDKGIELPSFEEADNESNPNIVAHFVHVSGAEWWVIAGEKLPYNDSSDMLLLGMAEITFREMGTYTLSELLQVGAVLDTDWEVKGLYDVFPLS